MYKKHVWNMSPTPAYPVPKRHSSSGCSVALMEDNRFGASIGTVYSAQLKEGNWHAVSLSHIVPDPAEAVECASRRAYEHTWSCHVLSQSIGSSCSVFSIVGSHWPWVQMEVFPTGSAGDQSSDLMHARHALYYKASVEMPNIRMQKQNSRTVFVSNRIESYLSAFIYLVPSMCFATEKKAGRYLEGLGIGLLNPKKCTASMQWRCVGAVHVALLEQHPTLALQQPNWCCRQHLPHCAHAAPPLCRLERRHFGMGREQVERRCGQAGRYLGGESQTNPRPV